MIPILRRSIWVRVVLVTAITLVAVADSQPQAKGAPSLSHLKKLDGLLRADTDQRASGQRRVIVRARPGQRAALKRLLASQGQSVEDEFDSGDALSLSLSAERLEAL